MGPKCLALQHGPGRLDLVCQLSAELHASCLMGPGTKQSALRCSMGWGAETFLSLVCGQATSNRKTVLGPGHTERTKIRTSTAARRGVRQPDYSRGGLSCGPARLHRPPHCPDPARVPCHKHKGGGGRATSQPSARGLLAAMKIGVAPARRGWRGRATTRPHQPTSPTPTYLTTSKRVRVQV